MTRKEELKRKEELGKGRNILMDGLKHRLHYLNSLIIDNSDSPTIERCVEIERVQEQIMDLKPKIDKVDLELKKIECEELIRLNNAYKKMVSSLMTGVYDSQYRGKYISSETMSGNILSVETENFVILLPRGESPIIYERPIPPHTINK